MYEQKKHQGIISSIFFLLGIYNAFVWFIIGGFYGGEWMILAYAVLFMLTGFQIHNNKSQAKGLGIASSILCLSGFPIGTVIGIYGLWYFIYAEKK